MKVFLSILVFVVLSYSNSETPSYTDINVTRSYNDSWNYNMTDTEMTAVPAKRLRCHVCSVDYLCEAPKACQLKDKYCVIVINVDDLMTSIFKYCSEVCPFTKGLRGREYRSYYTGCCVTDLCNFQKLGKGHKLGANIAVVAMALVACFTGAFQIGL